MKTITAADLTDRLTLVAEIAEHTAADLEEWTDAWRYPGGARGLINDVVAAGAAVEKVPLAKVTARLVNRLWLRRVPTAAIADIADIGLSTLEEHLRRTQRTAKGDSSYYAAQVVWLQHCAGKTPIQIAADYDIPRSYIYRILKREGAEPNTELRHAPTSRDDARLVQLYEAGKTYPEIVDRTGMSMSAVKRALARLHEEGKLESYGTRPGGRPPKHPTTQEVTA